MGMFEYEATLAKAISPDDMEFVANAYRAGQKKQQDELWNKLEPMFRDYENLYISKSELKKIIYG
jgi:hypothetical protein